MNDIVSNSTQVLNLIDVAIARAEGRVETAADMSGGSVSTSTRVTERMQMVDELYELRQAVLEVTATGRRVPKWLMWLCPKVKHTPRVEEPKLDWNEKVENVDWTGVFRG